MDCAELLARYQLQHRPSGASTGFRAIDGLTGGFRPGQVWIVTGTPGQGRTTLLVQWAAALAVDHGWRTWLASPRDDAVEVATRLLASRSGISRQDLMRRVAPVRRASELAAAQRALSIAPLWVTVPPMAVSTPEFFAPTGGQCAVVVDDADLTAWCNPEWISGMAHQGLLVVIAIPRDLLVDGPGEDADLLPRWTRATDVVIEVRSRNFTLTDSENGEALLTVLKHRQGPTLVTRVAFEGHYARFADLRE